MKATSFEIPNGCTRVTIEQHDNHIITTFEPEMVFKDGDIIKIIRPDGDCLIAIKKGDEKLISDNNEAYAIIGFTGKLAICEMANFGYKKEMGRKVSLSPESLPIIQDALAKVGKKWNAEKKCVEELKPERWRAEIGKVYWLVNTRLESDSDTEQFSRTDNDRYNAGNYFQTEQQAKDFAERIKQLPR